MWLSKKKGKKLTDSDRFIDLLSPSKKSTLYIHEARFWKDNEAVFPEDKCYCSAYQVLLKNCTEGDLFYAEITSLAINLATFTVIYSENLMWYQTLLVERMITKETLSAPLLWISKWPPAFVIEPSARDWWRSLRNEYHWVTYVLCRFSCAVSYLLGGKKITLTSY